MMPLSVRYRRGDYEVVETPPPSPSLAFRCFVVAVVAAVLLFWLSVPAHAENVAEQVFGQWQPVTVDSILKSVPEAEPDPRYSYGSVRKFADRGPALPPGCAIREGDKVVGASLRCLR